MLFVLYLCELTALGLLSELRALVSHCFFGVCVSTLFLSCLFVVFCLVLSVCVST